MNIISKLVMASALMVSITTLVRAQDPKRGDYYAPGQTTVQQVSPAEEQQIKDGDYYAPGRTNVQQVSPTQEQQIKEGDYYPPQSGK